MSKTRLEAFSDGVFAIIITIMVIELHVPQGAEWADLATSEVAGPFLAYVLSFVLLAIYWNNHHHMLHMADRVNGEVLWANMTLLFWLSLVPAATSWLGKFPTSAVPTAVYGVSQLIPGFGWLWLKEAIIRVQGPQSKLAAAVGRDTKGRLSAALYTSSIGLAFVSTWLSDAIFVIVALMWLIPDRRIEKRLEA